MYQSYARVIRVVVGVVAQMPGNGVDERSRVVATSRMHYQSGWFVNNEQFAVFIDNIERDVFRLNLVLIAGTVEQECDDVAWFYAIIALDGLTVDVDESSACCQLDAVSRCVWQMVLQKFVNAQQLLPAVGHDPEVFV